MNMWQVCVALILVVLLNQGDARISSERSKPAGLYRDPDNYEEQRRPNHGGSPVDIEVAMYVQAAEWSKHKLISVLYLRQVWRDERLTQSRAVTSVFGPQKENEIWVPDTYFPSALTVDRFDREGSITIDRSGNVRWSQRMKLETPCRAEVARLNEPNPHRVNCTISIESYAFTTNDLIYVWKSDEAITETAEIIKRTHEESKTISLSSGSYGRLQAQLYVETQPLYHLKSCIDTCFAGNIEQ